MSSPAPINPRVSASRKLRKDAADREAQVVVQPHTTNNDEAHYPDKIGTYSKCLPQDGPCRVNLTAFKKFRDAINSESPADFENIPLGGNRPLNGPQGAYAYTFEGTDASQFGDGPSLENQETPHVVPPPPAMASEAYGTELTELYWCSLMRDVAFTNYVSDPIAAKAATELSGMPTYAGPKDKMTGKVTPNLLFRGGLPGETTGPHISQLFIQPANLGALEINQKFTTYLPGIDYMTDMPSWEAVQNGIDTGLVNQKDPTPRYLHNGRGLAAFTHVDELYQAYLTAYLVLEKMGIPKNPGNPYIGSKTQQGFGTFGPPDFVSTLGNVAKIALNAVWYQKWVVHLRHRPESGGGIVHLNETGQGGTLSGKVNKNVLNSKAVAASFNKYGTYLLSQPFPEGSPAHPAYPTGHGTVGGACITVLKFFFDGAAVIPNPMIPSDDGLSLLSYSYSSADDSLMTVNGELHKLAHNVSFGHGIHGGIHWRSDTEYSILLGEAVAISILQDLAATYNEKFVVKFTKIDGSTATIQN